MDRLIRKTKERMTESVTRIEHELARIRAGRATPALLDGIDVEYYGANVPINQAATVAVPEPRLLTITPWDKSVLPKIRKAIMTSSLGLHPSDDGSMIRIEVPAPTEEGRAELAKKAEHVAEEGRVAVRNIRREAIEGIRAMEKRDGLSEDELRSGEKEVQRITDKFIEEIDDHVARKRKEIMEV